MFIRCIKKITLIFSIAFVIVPSLSAAESLRVLAYGDSNTWGWVPTAEGYPTVRYSDRQRWSGVLETALGKSATVVNNGLVGRTTDLNALNAVGAVAGADFNGQRNLAEAVASSMPLDWVVIMLGTNDLQVSHQRKPVDIAKVAFNMAEQIRTMSMPLYSKYPAPKVLIVAPPAFGDTSKTPLSGLFSVGEKPSEELGKAFNKISKDHKQVMWLDAGKVIKTDGVDGIHLTAKAHEQLGKAIGAVLSKY